jgi:flavodoxin
MTKILVLYYSSYGHIEQMAETVATGASVDARRCLTSNPSVSL